MGNFKKLLDKFDLVLKKYNRPNYGKMQNPLSNVEIDFYLNKLGINDNNIRTLFEWKNGFDASKGIGKGDEFTYFGILFSLKDIVSSVEHNPADYSQLRPIFGEFSGDWLLFNNKNDQDYGRIYLHSVSLLAFDKDYIIYDSLYTLIETTIKGYEAKALVFNENEPFLDVDIDKYDVIAKKLNKHSNFWTR